MASAGRVDALGLDVAAHRVPLLRTPPAPFLLWARCTCCRDARAPCEPVVLESIIPKEQDSEMEITRWEVDWGVLLGSTPVGKGKEAAWGREKS